MPSKLPRLLHYASLLLFFASLALPAFHADQGTQPGWSALIIGWLPAASNVLSGAHGEGDWLGMLAWLANPLLMATWILMSMKKRWPALLLSSATLATGCLFFLQKSILIPDGGMLNHVEPGAGCYVWLAGMALAAASSVAALVVKGTQNRAYATTILLTPGE